MWSCRERERERERERAWASRDGFGQLWVPKGAEYKWNFSRCGISSECFVSTDTTASLSSSFPPFSCFYFLLQLFFISILNTHIHKYSLWCGLLCRQAGWLAGVLGCFSLLVFAKALPFHSICECPFYICLFLCFHPSTCQLLRSQTPIWSCVSHRSFTLFHFEDSHK